MNADMRPSITLRTLGCKLNQAETEQLALQFAARGWRVTDGDSADVCIVNTCTVTHIADRKSRHLVRMLKKRNPQGQVIAAGCYAERASEALLKAGADSVSGNGQKESLAGRIRAQEIRSTAFPGSANGSARVRSFIKIQDGCSNFCTYCIVPFVRGPERSLAIEDIIARIQQRTRLGYREAVLTGTRIGTYNREGLNLSKLIESILLRTDIDRLHLSSLEPGEVTEELLRICLSPRVCRHFHLALQHGSAAVLKRMHRRYTPEQYRDAVGRIRGVLPDAAVTTDIMVGFPGESNAEFEESITFCQQMDFAALHIFPYSSRPGTAAAAMPGQAGEPLKKERSRIMLELARQSVQRFARRFTGQRADVLWENEEEAGSGLYSGLSLNYLRVYTHSVADLTNSITPVLLTCVKKGRLQGEQIL